MSSSTTSFVLHYVCPSIGVVLASLTFSAPVTSVRRAAAEGSLGVINSTPFIFMTGNTVGWMTYSFVTNDLFVYFANAPGLMISLWLNLTAIQILATDRGRGTKTNESSFLPPENDVEDGESAYVSATHMEENTRTIHPSTAEGQRRSFLFIISLWMALCSVVGLTPDTTLSYEYKKDLIGTVANINLAFFYASPLSTISTVVRTRDSSTIHRRTLVLNTVNSSFWLGYGLAILDPFICLPNLAGVILGIIQVILCLSFGRGPDSS